MYCSWFSSFEVVLKSQILVMDKEAIGQIRRRQYVGIVHVVHVGSPSMI